MAKNQGKAKGTRNGKTMKTTIARDGERIPEPENQQEVAVTLVHFRLIAALAYEFWQARRCPDGTPDEDWFRAEETLKNRARSISTAA